jgi:hypothetical protein
MLPMMLNTIWLDSPALVSAPTTLGCVAKSAVNMAHFRAFASFFIQHGFCCNQFTARPLDKRCIPFTVFVYPDAPAIKRRCFDNGFAISAHREGQFIRLYAFCTGFCRGLGMG